MKPIQFFVFSVLSGMTFLVASCDPAKEFATELKTIDSSLAELDSIENLYNGIQFDSLSYMVRHIMENEDKIKRYYTSDTVDMQLGMYMNNCKGVRKSMKGISQNKTVFAEEIAALDTQFTNLKSDILNGLLEKEQVASYLAEELAALNKLSLSFYEFYDNQKVQSYVFYSASPQVDAYVAKLVIPENDTLPY
jgi:hypothetical protein